MVVVVVVVGELGRFLRCFFLSFLRRFLRLLAALLDCTDFLGVAVVEGVKSSWPPDGVVWFVFSLVDTSDGFVGVVFELVDSSDDVVGVVFVLVE